MKQNTSNSLNTEGLKFFGKINASISHELKNIFAIISETNGFLNDLTQLAKQGKKFDLSILENCNNSIAEEIERGFHTIRQMNKFAHSVDEPVKEIDVMECLELVTKLTKFLSYAKPVRIIPLKKNTPVITCPFLLQSLIYHVLCCLYNSIQKGEITVQFESKKETYLNLIFSGHISRFSDYYPSPDINKMLDMLSVEINVNFQPFKLEMIIPLSTNFWIKGMHSY